MIYRQIGYKTNVLIPINTNETALETIANTFVPTIEPEMNMEVIQEMIIT